MLGPALRMVVSLAAVLALMYVAARLLGRRNGMVPARATSRPALKNLLRRTPRALLTRDTAGVVRQPKRGRRTAGLAQVQILARQPLGKTASVALVRVGGRTILLGVTDTAVQLLSEFDATAFDETDRASDSAAQSAGGTAVAVTRLASRRAAPTSDRTSVRVPESSVDLASASIIDVLRERTVRRA